MSSIQSPIHVRPPPPIALHPGSAAVASQESQASGLYSIISLNPLVACARSRIQLGMISGWSLVMIRAGIALLEDIPKSSALLQWVLVHWDNDNDD